MLSVIVNACNVDAHNPLPLHRFQALNIVFSFVRQVQPTEVAKAEQKAVDDVAAWGATKRRTTQPKPRESCAANAESQDVSADSQVVSTNSSVASNQTGNPARLRAHARSKVVRKEKEQTLTATLTERSEVARRVFDADMHEAEEPVPNIDEHDVGNQLAVVDYIEDIYSFYRKSEVQSCVPPDYMSRQSDINEKMRAILIDWLIEVCFPLTSALSCCARYWTNSFSLTLTIV